MSLQLQTPYFQAKKLHVSGNKSDDDVVSRIIPITLDLFDTKQSSFGSSLACQEGFLDTKIKQKRRLEDHSLETMSKRNESNNLKLDLKLNLSPPRANTNTNANARPESPGRAASISPPSSCVSSEQSQEEMKYLNNSPEATTSMVLVGCPMCLMYVMLSENDPKCPKCKSTVLLDFNNNNSTK